MAIRLDYALLMLRRKTLGELPPALAAKGAAGDGYTLTMIRQIGPSEMKLISPS